MESDHSIYLNHIMKTIIVGNSPQLLQVSRGKNIDSFDIVIRTGNFILNGFEQYTGEKTSIWCNRWCKMLDQTSTDNILHDVSQVWLSDIDQREFTQEPDEYINHVNKKIQVKYFSRDLLTSDLRDYEPTLGLISILMARDMYSECDLYITGFGLDITSGDFIGTYWDQKYTRRTKESNHSFLRESILIKRMIHSNFIKSL